MPGGRPTKYDKSILEKANKYMDDFHHYGALFPSHTGLALYLELNTDTLYDWAKQEEKKEFSDILSKIKAIQHEMVMGGGISGDFNSNIVKLLLGKHGYSEKQQQEISGPDGGPQEHKWEIEIKDTTNA
jgi:hypothetical protein